MLERMQSPAAQPRRVWKYLVGMSRKVHSNTRLVSIESEGGGMSDDEDDYEYLFDILYTLFGFVIFVFAVIGITAIVFGLISLL